MDDPRHPLELIFHDNGFMGVLKNGLFRYGIFSLLLVPDGMGVGLEVDRTARVLSPFQNVDHGSCIFIDEPFPLIIGILAEFLPRRERSLVRTMPISPASILPSIL